MRREKAARLWNRAYRRLLDQILQMRVRENRLDPEEILARRLEVSRTTVREAMQTLVREGYVTRRHGDGNYAHPSIALLHHRIDLNADFARLIGTDDTRASYRNLRCGYAPAGESMRRRFPVPCETVYEQHWLYMLDEKPMIFCRISLPEEILSGTPEPPKQDEALADWMDRCLGRNFAYYAAHLDCRADSEANWALKLPAGRVVQNWHEIMYDLSDEPVAFCDIFFHPEHMDLSMVLRP